MAFKDKEKPVRRNLDTHQEELTARLKHYNEWMMDNDRDFTIPYPGYPDGKAKKPTTPVVEKPAVAPIKRKKGSEAVMKIENVSVKVMNTRVTRGPKQGTKQSAANKLVAYLGTHDKNDVIKEIMQKLDMSKAGATTYFHNAKRFLSSPAGQSLANPD